MAILLFGANGQVGREIQALAAAGGLELVIPERSAYDLCVVGDAATQIKAHAEKITGVINASAYTAVDQAETEQALAEAINTIAPGEMAAACKELGLPFVHYSTDYVFNGDKETAYLETDPVDPLGVYGRSKQAGEEAIIATGANAAILRLAWVFSPHGKNFVKTMLRLSESHQKVRVVADQVGAPSPASSSAKAGLTALQTLKAAPEKAGIYHFGGDSALSWAEFAEAIFELADKSTQVEHIPSSEYPTPVKRPAYSVLNSSKFQDAFGLPAADWRRELNATLKALNA